MSPALQLTRRSIWLLSLTFHFNHESISLNFLNDSTYLWRARCHWTDARWHSRFWASIYSTRVTILEVCRHSGTAIICTFQTAIRMLCWIVMVATTTGTWLLHRLHRMRFGFWALVWLHLHFGSIRWWWHILTHTDIRCIIWRGIGIGT